MKEGYFTGRAGFGYLIFSLALILPLPFRISQKVWERLTGYIGGEGPCGVEFPLFYCELKREGGRLVTT